MANPTHIITTTDTSLDIPTTSTYKKGNSKDYCVIDWISMTTNCTAACTVDIQVLDGNTNLYWKAQESLAVDTATTIYADFAGLGLPFKGNLTNFSGNHWITTDGQVGRAPNITCTPGTGDGTFSLTVAYHWEPFSLRQS